MSRHTNSKGSIWKEIKRPSFHFLSFFGGVAFLATLAACGGGSSGGGGSPAVGTSGNLVYTGSNSATAFLRLIDTAYASSSPTNFTLVLSPVNTFYIFIDDLGDQASGTYTQSGSSITISSSNNIFLASCNTTTGSLASSCLGSISANLTNSGSNLTGTITIKNGTTTLSTSNVSLTASSAWNQSGFNIAALEGKTINGSPSPPSSSSTTTLNCFTPPVSASSQINYGSVLFSVNGASYALPCNSPPSAYDSSTHQITAFGTETVYFCSSLGTDCSHTSTNSPKTSNTILTDAGITIPQNALGLFGVSVVSTQNNGNPALDFVGYVQQSSPGSTVFYFKDATEFVVSSGSSGTCSNTLAIEGGALFGVNIGSNGYMGVAIIPSTVQCIGTASAGFSYIYHPSSELGEISGFSF